MSLSTRSMRRSAFLACGGTSWTDWSSPEGPSFLRRLLDSSGARRSRSAASWMKETLEGQVGLRQFDLSDHRRHLVESIDGHLVGVAVTICDGDLDPATLAIGDGQRDDRGRQTGTIDFEDVTGLDPAEGKRDVLTVGVFVHWRRNGGHQFVQRSEVALDAADELAAPVDETFEPLLALDDVSVGPELGERQIQQLPGSFLVVTPHQVGCHVVGRTERRCEYEVLAGGQPGDLFEGHKRRPQHDSLAFGVDPSSTGPPGQLRELCRRERLVVIAGPLRQLVEHNGPGRHVDTEGQRLGREHDLREAPDETGLDRFLHRRDHAGVMRCDAGLETSHEMIELEHLAIARGQRSEAISGDGSDFLAFGRGGQLQAGVDHGASGFRARSATEDEVDGGQQIVLAQCLDRVDPGRGPPRTGRSTLRAVAAAPTPVGAQICVEAEALLICLAADERLHQVEFVALSLTDEIEILEPDRPLMLDHQGGLAANGRHPLGEFLCVRHGG